MIAKMNVLFDKATFEKSRPIKNLESNDLKEDAESVAEEDGKVIKDTILNSIQSAKLGALTVDPGYLHFRTLDSKQRLFHMKHNRQFLLCTVDTCCNHN